MENLLLLTDFSANATHAASFGYHMAKQLKANVILCNAITVPAEVPQATIGVWPMDEYDVLMDGSSDELKELKAQLMTQNTTDEYNPSIGYTNEAGILTDVIKHTVSTKQIDLMVMGSHGNTGLSGFIMGNHLLEIINNMVKPVLIVPSSATIAPIKKIAFATDFTEPEHDLETIYELIPMARKLNAEILLTHVYDEKHKVPEFKKWIKDFLTEISNKANYPNIFYRIIKNDTAENGLEWLCHHGQIDMLVMVHRKRSFFEKLIMSSHTKKVAGHTNIPLLIYPGAA